MLLLKTVRKHPSLYSLCPVKRSKFCVFDLWIKLSRDISISQSRRAVYKVTESKHGCFSALKVSWHFENVRYWPDSDGKTPLICGTYPSELNSIFFLSTSLCCLSLCCCYFPTFSSSFFFNPSCSQDLQLTAYNTTLALISLVSCCLLVQLAATCPHPRGLTFKCCVTGPDLITALICDIQTGLIMPQLRGTVWPPITTTCILIVSSPRPHKHAVCCLYFSHRLPRSSAVKMAHLHSDRLWQTHAAGVVESNLSHKVSAMGK